MLSFGIPILRRTRSLRVLRATASLSLVLLLVAPSNAFAFAAAVVDGTANEPAKPAALTGTVKSLSGAPVGEANVVLRRASTDDLRTRTDADGRFNFTNLKEGSGTLIASAGEDSSVLFVDIKAGENEVQLTFDRKQLFAAVAGNLPEPTQTPAPQSPAQRDATRPPTDPRRQQVPPEARPRPADPTAPPNKIPTSPQSPPTTRDRTPQTAPTPTTAAPTTGVPVVTQTPVADPSAQQEQPISPILTDTQPRPVPPMPSLTRLGVTGGDTLPLSLNEAIRRALENNNDIEVARYDVRLAESLLQAFEGFYDPVFVARPLLNHSVSPVSSALSGSTTNSGSVTRTSFGFDHSFVKPIRFAGGSYEVFFNNERLTTNNQFERLNPSYGSNLGVTVTQPLWRNRAIDAPRRNIRIQRKRLEQSDADFRRRTIEVIAQVQRAYWDLVFAIRDEQNQIANLNLARENFRRTEASVAAGAVAPLERAEVQTELSNRESALLLATQSVSIAENNLKSLLLKDPLAPEWSKVFVPTEEPKFDDTPVDLQAAVTEARANRPELRRLRIEQDVNQIDLDYFRNQTKPRIDLTGTFTTTGLAGSPAANILPCSQTPAPPAGEDPLPCVSDNFVGGYGRSLRNLFGLDTKNIVVGVTIEIPLRNRTARANLTTAQIERDQLTATTRSQEQVVEVEVRNAAQSVETSRRRVLAARSARENAEVQLAGERRLYQVGRSTTFILFQRENALVNARNQELRAETDYNKALADLQRATSTTLRANNVSIESPIGR